MKALIISAHPDDEILGCGSTTSKLRSFGHTVDTFIIGNGRGSPLDNRFDSRPLLDLVERIEKRIELLQPSRIYTHSACDLNVDHSMVHKAVLTATRPVPGQIVKEVYCFETVSSTEWNFDVSFKPNLYETISYADLIYKIGELRRLYQEEMREAPHPRSTDTLIHLAAWRGSTVGAQYAEAFEVIREIR